MDGELYLRLVAVVISGLLWAACCFGYSGTCGIWAQKRNSFIATNYPGTQAGFDAAKTAVGTNGSIFIYGGCEGLLTIGTLQDSVFVYAYDSAKWTVYGKAGSWRDRSGQARLDVDSLGIRVTGTGIVPRLGPASSAGSGGAIRIVDGVTFALTGAGIQAALNDLPSAGGTIKLPAGTFTITSSISRAIASVEIVGAGESTILNYTPTTGNCITVGGNGWKVRSLRITSANSATSGASIYGTGTSDVLIDDVHVVAGFRGIAFDTGARWSVRSCLVESTVDIGIHVSGSMSDAKLSDCIVRNGSGPGFQLGGLRATITNCIAQGNVIGFLVRDSSENRVIGCQATANTAQGFLIDSTIESKWNLIEGCTSARNLGTSGEGITLFQSTTKHNIVRGNICVNNAANQIEVFDTGGYNIIEGNFCLGDTAGANGIYIGATAGAGSPYTIVANNTCYRNRKNGVQILESKGAVVTGNVCVENNQGANAGVTDQNGITLNGASTNCIVSSNRATNETGTTQKYGIRLENTATATISDNRLVGNATGPLLDSVVGSVIHYGESLTNATLPVAANGTTVYCSDCTKATPCAGGGNGGSAVRINGAWDCNP